MRDLRHGNEIKHVLQKHNNNLKELIRYDDRFHPVMAVDVAARFLMEHFSRVKRTNPRMSQKDLWDLALKRYSGRPHYQYGAKVIAYRNKINDRQYIRGIASRFPSYGVKI
jgi:hypothetical protein